MNCCDMELIFVVRGPKKIPFVVVWKLWRSEFGCYGVNNQKKKFHMLEWN